MKLKTEETSIITPRILVPNRKKQTHCVCGQKAGQVDAFFDITTFFKGGVERGVIEEKSQNCNHSFLSGCSIILIFMSGLAQKKTQLVSYRVNLNNIKTISLRIPSFQLKIFYLHVSHASILLLAFFTQFDVFTQAFSSRLLPNLLSVSLFDNKITCFTCFSKTLQF